MFLIIVQIFFFSLIKLVKSICIKSCKHYRVSLDQKLTNENKIIVKNKENIELKFVLLFI